MKNYHAKIFKASLFVALSGILYGFLGFLGTVVLRENMSIPTMLFWRFLIAGVWILLFIICNPSSRQLLNSIDKRALFFIFFLGALGYAGSSEFYFIASQYLGTGLAMVIFFSYPIIVALVSWLMHGQRFNKSMISTLIMMTVGLFLLRNTTTQSFNSMGILLALLAAICYAFYVLGSKRISTGALDSTILTMLICFSSAFIFLGLAISSAHFSFPHSTKSWFYLFALSILATALPIQLMLAGLKYVSSMRASIISVLEPLVTMLVGVLLLDESLSNLQILGTLVILGSALLVQFQKEL